ncbi:MAG: flagellar biosynthetic protein FliO [Acidobacteria bacterium]|jgi:flagellar protein FliO/FliZ|nr:flagellar biosynthetic protein FliO [Acidobacteriota bacterium]
MTLMLALAQAPDPSFGIDGGGLIRAFIGLVVVLGVIGLLAWLLRRGVITLPGQSTKGPLAVHSTLQLGERRSLAIVSVEGRRLLIGLTPTQVTLLTELGEGPAPFERVLDGRSSGPVAGQS